MNNTSDIETILAYEYISGPDLAEKMFLEPLENLGVEHLFGQVERIEDHGATKRLSQMMGNLKLKPW